MSNCGQEHTGVGSEPHGTCKKVKSNRKEFKTPYRGLFVDMCV